MATRNEKSTDTPPDQAPKIGEKTVRQNQLARGPSGPLNVLIYGKEKRDYTKPHPGTFKTYRQMRNNPTIALARIIATSPCRSAKWIVENDDDANEDAVELVQDVADELLGDWLSWACLALDFGFQSWEQIWVDDGEYQKPDRLKPLCPEMTEILVDADHGNYAGLKQEDLKLPTEKTIHYSYDAEPGNLYGRSRHENCRETAWAEWEILRKRLQRYTKRVAGATPIIIYPQGEDVEASGAKRSNFDIARQIMAALEDCDGVAMPNMLMNNANIADILRNGGDPSKLRTWFIDFIEAKDSHGGEFKELMTYHDQLMMRGWLVPERAATEAQTGGSRADSESHGEIAAAVGESVLDDMLSTWNKQLVNRILAVNFGRASAGTVRVVRVPLTAAQKRFYQGFVQQFMVEPSNIDLLLKAVNMPALLKQADLPVKDTAEDIGPDDVKPADDGKGESPESSLSLARETYRRMGKKITKAKKSKGA